MYKIMIVDDEGIERRAMRHMINNGVKNAEIVSEAANGKEAVRLAGIEVPDIILMDIKMPGLDGVEAVKRIKKIRPEMKFIMVSAYDTFEYAREVMQEGVKEYLLKPSRKDEILATVERVMDELDIEREKEQERQALEVKLDQALSFVRSEWVTSLLLDHVRETEPVRWREFLELKDGWIYAIVCRLIFQNTVEKKRGYAFLKKTFEDQGEGGCLVGPMSGELVPVLIVASNEEQTVRSQAVKTANHVLHAFDHRKGDLDLRIGIGTAVKQVSDFIKSYEEALISLEEANNQIRYFIYHPSFVQKTENDAVRAEKQLLEAVKDGDEDGALSSFERYNREINKNQHERRKAYENLSFMLKNMAQEMGVPLQLPSGFPEDAGPRQLQELVKIRLVHAVEEIRQWQSDSVHGLMQGAKLYIDHHYNELVTLEDVAAHANLSAYYFSKLFKEQTGTTFIEYLTGVRIVKAKELLKTTRMSLKEICFKVGYHDPNYFSRVFKKITGRSPSDYRLSVTSSSEAGEP